MSEKLEVVNPYDLSTIANLDMVGKKEVEAALKKASGLFENRSKWIPKYERVEILERTIKIMESQKEELTKIAAEEGGKPWVDSMVEVERAIYGVKLAIEDLGYFGGEEIPMGQTRSSANRMAFTRKEPIGVVSSISAFNHPLNLIVHQTVPAIAVGAPVLVKPALTTPRSCIRFVEILKEAGLPEGWCEYLICGNEAAEQLVTDNRVNFFSFIGSAKVGWYLRSKLSPGTRCALEHGGAAPLIVEPDANIEEMLPGLIKGAFYHSGQVCVSVQRVFVHNSILKTATDKIVDAAKKLKVGSALEKETDCGPLILPREVDRVAEWVDEAKEKGAEILLGGTKLGETTYAPTVILNPPADCKVSAQEIFGPVVCLYGYDDVSEAIDQSNGLEYAFQASVYTSNLDSAINISHQINAAAVMINDHTAFRVDWMPFGGRDSSGLGVGGIRYSMEDMSREKLLVFKSKHL